MTNTLQAHDKAQRQQALDANQSFIVQAPAGSGKTSLLIQRYLKLLSHVNAPEEILAITFTKKAANEMRSRVLGALKQAQYETEPTSAHEKEVWLLAKSALHHALSHQWDIINNPNQLRIQTIDSFCAYLTKQLPMLAHFGAPPDMADMPTMLYESAVKEVLTHIEENVDWSEAIATLLLHLDNDLNKLHDLLIRLLAKRDQWLPYIHLDADTDTIKKLLEHNLSSVVNDQLQPLKNLLPLDLIPELLAILRFAASNLSQDLHSWDNLPDQHAKHLTAWQWLAECLLTKDGDWRKKLTVKEGFPAPSSAKNPLEKNLFSEYKERAAELISKLSDNSVLQSALSELKYLPNLQYQADQWKVLQALLMVLKVTAAQLRLSFQAHGQIDFIENTQAAITALGDDESPTDLALALDYQIKHILVDEFQDTSYTQYQLLEKLTAGWESGNDKTLFIVGDPMQSIYRFREAEVGLFLRMQTQGLGNIKLTPLTLSVNFRSTSTIVEWNNKHFKEIFPSNNNIATGAVIHSPSTTITTQEAASNIQIFGFTSSHDTEQAEHIVSLINSNTQLGKTAILVRARQHLKTIIPALKKAGIPYQAIDIDPLEERQHIQDLLSLTQALLHPADRIAWLAILRAPWCGLTLADMLVLAGNDSRRAIPELLDQQDLIATLSTDGQHRLKQVWDVIKSQLAERGRENLRAWIETTWQSIGGPACLSDEAELDDTHAYFKLLDEFNQSPGSFSTQLLRKKIQKLYATSQSNDATLQIMTIHSAKGLEFDTVILPRLEKKSATDNPPLLLWMEYPLLSDRNALLLAPIHATGNEQDSIYQFIQRQQRIKSNYEIDRLLYVATTRAKNNLYLLFDIEQRDNNAFQVDSSSLLKKLWPFFANNLSEILVTENTSQQPSNKPSARKLSRLSSDWQHPSPQYKAKATRHNKSSGFKLADKTLKHIGTITHSILELIAKQGVPWWQNISKNTAAAYVKRQLAQLGVLHNELDHALHSVTQAVESMLSDPTGLWILKAHPEAQSEWPLSTQHENETINIILDRSFIDETGTRWIIDYKTATHSDIEDYRAKMQLYANAVKQIDKRPIKMALYFPMTKEFIEL